LDFGVQFDKLTVRAVTKPVEVQSNDLRFWIDPAYKGTGLGDLRFEILDLFHPRGVGLPALKELSI
jgi:hypothetical protein